MAEQEVNLKSETSLGMAAEDFYNEQRGNRQGVVDIGRRVADMTIPSAFPPEDYDTSHDSLAITNQGLNALMVSSLANALTLSALPPELPMCKFEPVESEFEADFRANPELVAIIEYDLARLEEKHRKRLNTTGARDAYARCMTQFILPGNVLCLWTNIDQPKVYNMHSWVVKRDSEGFPMAAVIQESISLAVADKDVVEAVRAERTRRGSSKLEPTTWEDEAFIYHVQKYCKEDDEWLYWQETEGGYVIPGTEYYSEKDVPPMMPAGLIMETGSNYGLGYAHLFEGDLQSMEELQAAVKDGAALLAWFLTFVDPTGQTDIRDVRKADNLSVLPGRAEDVTAYTSGKAGDLNWVSAESDKVARRLGQAFAYEASIQRTGERVTREEWVTMVRALQKAMGNLYTAIGKNFQRWFILRFLHLHRQEDKKLSKLPKHLVSVEILTGLDGIGRNSEYDNLMGWATDAMEVLTPQGFAQEINGPNFLMRLASGRAIRTDGLVKSPEQKQSEAQDATQQAQQQALLEKATGPVAQGGMDMMAQMMASQQQGTPNE